MKALFLIALITGLLSSDLMASENLKLDKKGKCSSGKSLYKEMACLFPRPKLDVLDGREYKTLIELKEYKDSMPRTFEGIWKRIKEEGKAKNFDITESSGDPLKIDHSIKEYFDTEKQDLWKAGYLIRASTKLSEGEPEPSVGVTIKSIKPRPMDTLNTPLDVSDSLWPKRGAEENVSFFPGGNLGGYIEKGVSFSIKLEDLKTETLGDFGHYMPELLDLGLPSDTLLVGKKAFASKVVPGKLTLGDPKNDKDQAVAGMYIEAWSHIPGGEPFVIDFSFGYETDNYYDARKIHKVAERFMNEVVKNGMSDLISKSSEKWVGSKVRLMMNRPFENPKN